MRLLGFMLVLFFFFCKTTIIRQLTKWNESKNEKIQSKTIAILLESLRVSVCVGACVSKFHDTTDEGMDSYR